MSLKMFIKAIVIIPFLLFGGEIEKELSFSIVDLEFGESKGYDVVRLGGCRTTAQLGEPELAIKPVLVLIPPDAQITGVEVVSSEKISVKGIFTILPSQYPEPISLYEPLPFVEPDEHAYSLTNEYPGVLAEHTHTGIKGGYRLATIALYPLQYIPKEGRLFLYTHIRFKVIYEKAEVTPETVWKEDCEYQQAAVKRLIINPEHVEEWGPMVRQRRRSLTHDGRGASFDDPEYAIMVANGLESYLEPLRDWKVKKGVPTEIFLRDWILSTYAGSSNEEKVRNFIIDYHQNHGTLYFLCVGDWGDFPMKTVNTTAANNVPTDFYYQDYDDDYYSEVYVGRASVSNGAEAQTFVNKVLTYEQEPQTSGFHEKIFLPAYELWSGYGSPVNDTIAFYDPLSWFDAKRYDWNSSLTTAEISDSFNVGFEFTQISAHGLEYGWGSSIAIYHDNDDADALTNAPPNTGIVTAICCQIGALDYASDDCYVEHMMNNSNGGTIAFWGNTRDGYGRIEDKGRSEWLNIWFYEELNDNSIYNVGRTCAAAKDQAVPYVSGDDYVNHCVQELTLYGDPELSQYTTLPTALSAGHASTVPVGSAPFDVTVTDESRAPIENARVCLMCKEDTMYRVDYTNAFGVANFITDPDIDGDTMFVTATKHNYTCYEGYAVVSLTGVNEWVEMRDYTFNLAQPYPNPSLGRVETSYSLPSETMVSLKVYNTAGQMVAVLIDQKQAPGIHTISWNTYKEVGSGIYFIKLSDGAKVVTRSVIVLK